MRDDEKITKLEEELQEAIDSGDAARVETIEAQLSAARTGE